MHLDLGEEQLLLQETFARLFARESTIDRVRATGNGGFDPGLWSALVATGAPIARIPAESGGLGLSLLDAALIAEAAGRHLASAPIVEVIVAARMLAAFAPSDSAWLTRIAEGTIVVFALKDACGGVARLIPGGAVAEAVLALDGDELVLVSGRHRAAPSANSGLLPVASWNLVAGSEPAERIVLAVGDAARAALSDAVAEWQILSAAYLAGLSRQALDAAAAYANERVQFGRPIGTFQGLAHPLADAVTEVEGGQLLVWRAISALAEHDDDAAALVGLCWWWMGQAAVKALRQSIRTLGGYGLSLEYDLHLYHRRGSALVLLGGAPDKVLQESGDRLFAGATGGLPNPGDVGISFNPGDAAQSHAKALEDFFEANWDARMRAKAHHSSSSHDADFHAGLARAGLIFGGWPAEHGGGGAGAAEDFETSLAFERWNYTHHVVTVTNMVAQIVMRYGSDAARAEILPRIKAGEAICSLGFSEPAAGSDVFAAKTAAVRDGGDWIVNGQKMFTTAGHYADYVLLLARTASGGAKYEGLTLFVVPTSSPGYDFQPVHTYQDERTNITFYADVRVPDRYRLGEVGMGSAVMSAALTLEHGGGAYFSGQDRMLRNALEWATTTDAVCGRPVDDPHVRAGLARVRARFEVAACFVARGISASATGIAQRYWGPMAKLFITESFLQSAWDVLAMAGPEAVVTGSHPLGMVELDHRRAYGTTIYGGTSEIHRSIVAEQALHLPKSRS